MPSKTPKQARFFAACSHGAGYESCPPQKVSTEFNQADAGTGILSKPKRKKQPIGAIGVLSRRFNA